MKRETEGWGLADSVVYATSIQKKSEVVMGDEHFKKVKGYFSLSSLFLDKKCHLAKS
ncbi:MAG TPA: hypothetical protein VMD05_04950 [Candidatus Nanoarchaeia archaeon]|nr:hypothetical protein [Candidatus Nanoarchaeia archaeon]